MDDRRVAPGCRPRPSSSERCPAPVVGVSVAGRVRHTDPMTTAAPPARRTLIVIVSVIAVLVIVSLIVVFTRGTPELLDESTPEGVVQRYTSALLEGDESTAIGFLSSDAKEQCGTVEMTVTDDARVTLVSTDQRDDSASVTVRITRHDGGPFGSEYGYEDTFRLVSSGGEWRVDAAPWELAVCPDGGVK